MSLDDYIDAARRASVMVMGVKTAASDALTRALADDAELAQEARARIANTRQLEGQDHITRWTNTLLRAALGAAP